LESGLVCGYAEVSGEAEVSGNAVVRGNARVFDDARVFENAWVRGKARVSGNAVVRGHAVVRGNARIGGKAEIWGGTWDGSEGEITEGRWDAPGVPYRAEEEQKMSDERRLASHVDDVGRRQRERLRMRAELEAMCRSEPEWACSQIRHLREELETVKKERDEARAEVETRLMMDGCPQCDHPMF